MAKTKNEPPVTPTPTELEQVDQMIEWMTKTIRSPRDLTFKQQKFSKKARIAELELQVEVLERLVFALTVEKLQATREDLRKGKARMEVQEFMAALQRVTTTKKGDG